jgi:hypothetical protein
MKSPVARSLTAALLLALLPLAARAAVPACDIPAEFTLSGEPMPRVAAALKPGGTLAVLAIGSAGVFGPDGGHPALGFPARMVAALRRAVPQATITLSLQGGRGLSAQAMLPMMKRALLRGKIGLVLWQTGTVEAVHNTPPGDFLEVLADGVSLAQGVGADMILVDPMFSRFLRANTNIDPYANAFRQVAIQPGVALFQRYDLTHAWVDNGSFDLEETARSEQPAVAAAMQDCIGQALAQFVLGAAHLAQ